MKTNVQDSLKDKIARLQRPYQTRFHEILKSMEVDGALMSVGLLVQHSCKQYGERPALFSQGKSMTYCQVYRAASALSLKLRDAGVGSRDAVLILFQNSFEFYVAYFAVLQIGAVAVPLNTFLHERELQHIVNDAQPRAIIAHTSFAETLRKASVAIPITFTEEDIELDVALADPRIYAFQPVIVPPDELAVLLYTSGTTGLPKGVMLSSTNIMTNVAQVVSMVSITNEERVYAVLPLFHSFAQNASVWAPFFVGASVIVVPRIERRAILEGLKDKPTIFLGIPALYGLLCLMKTAPIESVTRFVSGGDALPDKIRTAFALLYGRKISNGYGLTETSPVIAVHLEEGLFPANVVGALCPGIEVSLRDDQGHEVPAGQEGILWVKGGNVMMGYYHASQATHEVLQDGWLCTGDVVQFDADGRMAISGRHKDLIIHKGFNIYPPEIENVMFNHRSVLRVAVVGKPDPDVGEVVVAFVELKDEDKHEKETIEKELALLCRQQLAPYKVPRQFVVRDRLPVTATGKVSKKELRRLLSEAAVTQE